VIDYSKPITVTNGVFNVPVYIDESNYYRTAQTPKNTFGVMEKIFERRMNELKKKLMPEQCK